MPMRLLLIDDERPIVAAIRRLMSTDDVVGAHTGADALRLLRESEPFDVVVCDLMLPDCDGEDVYVEATRVAPDLEPRFLFMTGGATTERAERFLAAVAPRTIRKPFDPQGMSARLREHASKLSTRRLRATPLH